MKKWVRNILLGIAINWLKNTEFAQKLIARLKDRKTLVGRIGLLLFTVLAGVKYYRPDFPIDDGVEILGMIFSWIALEIGLDKSTVEKIENVAKKEFDPNAKLDLSGFELPSPKELGLEKKNITSDEE